MTEKAPCHSPALSKRYLQHTRGIHLQPSLKIICELVVSFKCVNEVMRNVSGAYACETCLTTQIEVLKGERSDRKDVPKVCCSPDWILRFDNTLRRDPVRRICDINHAECIHIRLVQAADINHAITPNPFFVLWEAKVDICRGRVAECLRKHGIWISEDDLVDDELAVLDRGGL